MFALEQFGASSTREQYISTVFLTIFVFIFFHRIQIKNNPFSSIGEKYTTFIYVFHPIIVVLLVHFIGNKNYLIWFVPFVTMVLSIMLGYIWRKARLLCQEKKH